MTYEERETPAYTIVGGEDPADSHNEDTSTGEAVAS